MACPDGPDLLQSLPGILYRFREQPVAVTADIQEMFLQIKIRKEDQPSQMFLWRGRNRSQAPRRYKMTSMIFGATSSPFLAHSVRNKNAKDYENSHPSALIAITRSHYMDDFVDSFANKKEAKRIIQEVDYVHKQAQFLFRGWNSNLSHIPEELRSTSQTQLMTRMDNEEKTLGLIWDSRNDELGFNTTMPRVTQAVKEMKRAPTKRETLSAVMSIYDPLGFLSPYTIVAKIMLQSLWREDIEWDEPIPVKQAEQFFAWLQALDLIRKLRLPRCYSVPRGSAAQGSRQLQCNDLVVIVDPTLPRNIWPRGIVEKIYPGPDGEVRCADVRTKGGVFRRPTRKLAVLSLGQEASTPESGV